MVENKSCSSNCREELCPEEKLKLLFEYVGRIADEPKLDNLLLLMADLGRKLIVADRCTLWIYDKKNTSNN